MKDHAAIFEKPPPGRSAYDPHLPGLGVAGPTYEATEGLLREGIIFHVRGIIVDGDMVPEPTTRVALMPVLA